MLIVVPTRGGLDSVDPNFFGSIYHFRKRLRTVLFATKAILLVQILPLGGLLGLTLSSFWQLEACFRRAGCRITQRWPCPFLFLSLVGAVVNARTRAKYGRNIQTLVGRCRGSLQVPFFSADVKVCLPNPRNPSMCGEPVCEKSRQSHT